MPTKVSQRSTGGHLRKGRAKAVSPIGSSLGSSHERDMREDPTYRAEFERTSAYEKTARAVIALREVRGLTQEQLAEMIGTTASAISRLESGEHSPNLETLRKIANACGGHLRLQFDVPGRRSRELVARL